MKDFIPDETKSQEKEKKLSEPKAIERPTSSTFEQRITASPVAKKSAYDHGIELKDINGSGPKGRILLQDVLSKRSALYTDIPLKNMRKTISKRLVEPFTTITSNSG